LATADVCMLETIRSSNTCRDEFFSFPYHHRGWPQCSLSALIHDVFQELAALYIMKSVDLARQNFWAPLRVPFGVGWCFLLRAICYYLHSK
jgi:hypothetical protein